MDAQELTCYGSCFKAGNPWRFDIADLRVARCESLQDSRCHLSLHARQLMSFPMGSHVPQHLFHSNSLCVSFDPTFRCFSVAEWSLETRTASNQ